MKKYLILILSLISLSALSQSQPAPKTGGVALRVNDSTAYIATQVTAHSQGYADIFWNNQASTPHYDIWNGSSYDHVFTFGGSGGGTQDLQSVLDEGATATITDVNVNITSDGVSDYGQMSVQQNSVYIAQSNNANTEQTSIEASVDGIKVLDTRTGRGIQGMADFSASIQANDFTQKNYVDAADALKGNLADPLSQFASTTSSQFAGVISDEVGTGSVALSEPDVNVQTGSYTLVLSDKAKEVRMNVAGSNNLTVPLNSSVAFPTGTMIVITQYGAGLTTVVATGGVTIRSQSGVLTSPSQYSPMVLRKIGTDEWFLWNGTSAITASNGLSISSGNITAGGPVTSDINFSGTKNIGFGITPTATLHLRAGTATASTAPLKLTSGTLMTTAEAGAIEFLTDDFFATISTGAARKAFILDNGNRLTSARVPFATTNGRLIDQSGFSFASSILTVPNLINSGLTSGRVTFATTSGQLTDDSGFLFSGTNDLLTTRLTPPAGTTAASTAPIKLTSGTNMTTPEAGAVEFDGTNYFVTSSTTRYTLSKTLTATATLDFPAAGASLSTDLTITVTGAADGDPVIVTPPNGSTVTNGIFTAWVSAANTVTVRFSNLNLVTNPDPASGTFRAAVLKY